MEFLTTNIGGDKPRREIGPDGRRYLVATATTIVPGVLAGSQGALLYTPDEIKRNVRAWDGIPLTLKHPADAYGRPVEAKYPGVRESQWIGRATNHVLDGDRLRAETWFDEAKVKRLDSALYDRLLSGDKIELSTGLYTDNEPVKNGRDRWTDGREYTHVAKNFRPDHLAILPDQRGACSVADGCGVNNAKSLAAAGEELANCGEAMPGYGQIFVNGKRAWYVGGDGDEDGFEDRVSKTLMGVEGVGKVTYEAEGFPPKDEGWVQVYPKQRKWVSNEAADEEDEVEVKCECDELTDGGAECDACKAKTVLDNTFCPTANGRWVTTDDGNRLYLTGGTLSIKPGGKVVDDGKSRSDKQGIGGAAGKFADAVDRLASKAWMRGRELAKGAGKKAVELVGKAGRGLAGHLKDTARELIQGPSAGDREVKADQAERDKLEKRLRELKGGSLRFGRVVGGRYYSSSEVQNAFCPTGEGEGQDNSCSSAEGGGRADPARHERLTAIIQGQMKVKSSGDPNERNTQINHEVSMSGKHVGTLVETRIERHVNQGGGKDIVIRVKTPKGKQILGSYSKVADAKRALAGHLAKGAAKRLAKGPTPPSTDNAFCPISNAANPKSLNTGRFKTYGSGTGRGDSHEAAQRGGMHCSMTDYARGADAKAQADAGHNPPGWAVDEDKWEKAKAAADKGDYDGDTYWAVVSHIYERMGGTVGGSTKNAFCPTGAGGGQDNSCSSREGGGGGGKKSDGGGGKLYKHFTAEGDRFKKMADEALAKGDKDNYHASMKVAEQNYDAAQKALIGFYQSKTKLALAAKKTDNAFCPAGKQSNFYFCPTGL